jgi:DNA transformation protein
MGNLDLLEEACAGLPHATRAMFGGHGLFAPNGGMFAGIVDDDRIIFKLAPEPLRAELVAEGGAPWVYKGKMGEMTMAEWITVPDAFYDEPRTLAAWAKRAHAAAPPKGAKKGAKKTAKKPAAKKAAKKAKKR